MDKDDAPGTSAGGSSTGGFEEKVRITSQPKLINEAHGHMRQYQIQGLNWLANLYQNGISGILADEMGLGKTLQSISLLAWLRESKGLNGPYLVLGPKSTLTNWEREFKNWCPAFKTLLFHGDRATREKMMAEELQPDKFDVCITSYEMVVRESSAFRKFSWRYLIVDEAHRMKNEESKLSQVRALYMHGLYIYIYIIHTSIYIYGHLGSRMILVQGRRAPCTCVRPCACPALSFVFGFVLVAQTDAEPADAADVLSGQRPRGRRRAQRGRSASARGRPWSRCQVRPC